MSTKPKIIFDPHFRTVDEILTTKDKKCLYQLGNIVWGHDTPMPDDEFQQALPDAEIVICSDWRYGDSLYNAKKLRAIITISGAFPLNLDYEYCHQNHIRVLSAAPAFARVVAEMCLGLALASCRDIPKGDQEMRAGTEKYLHEGNENTFMLFDQTVGIIGYGNIARVLHRLLKPFGVNILAFDPWLGDGYLESQGVIPLALDTLLTQSKVIFVLAAPSKENEAMLSRERLALIQQNGVLVLASRAHVVDFDAMTEFVLAKRFKVATDVFPTEPLHIKHPIRQSENAVLSAHRAGAVKEALWEIGEMVVQDIEAVLQGVPPRIMQNAEPELSMRYAVNRARYTNEDK